MTENSKTVPARSPGPTEQASQSLRIGDVAKLAGTTPRTIRYYEEIGLLAIPEGRVSGGHRLYGQFEVERLREIMRLKELLGVSLDELKELVAAEEARAGVRAELKRDGVAQARRRELLQEALGHLESQLALVRKRSLELKRLHAELAERRERVLVHLQHSTEPALPQSDAQAKAHSTSQLSSS